ncbi:sulfotransferase family protein [Mycolicibacterium gadium]|uniref:Sulfotransferase n=1 Tax=Mycolicibacterium gadium TaxID=1794 RepID=A0ABT6GW67_MYCGU|nr:sulfotransferase [Mycolicibacterium gadium]MDG5485598.1 sulfotransferase [Mycolicibacterium gadium]
MHLDDLAEPRFSPEAEPIREMMGAMAADCPLDADALHTKAAAETGLDDFGADDYRERLDVFLAALQDIPGMHDAGIVNFHAQLLQWLKNRLLLTDLLTRHPEIHDIELAPPVVIAGLPRTGTTHLHNLLGAAPTFRTIPYWESNEPFPLPSEAGIEPDPRRTRMDVAVEVMNIVMPHFALMHEMTTDHVHEEIQLLANDFSTMLFETLGHVPAWRDYYLSHDQTSHYEYLAVQLKALQFLRGGRRWLLKSPQHLEQLPVLNAVFPGVIVVFTHRDPVPVVLSMLAMLTYSARMHCYPVPVREIAATWIDRLELMLNALVRDRAVIAPERSVDVRFDDFMADEMGVVERIYDLAGEPLADDARTSIQDYLAGHQRGRLGRIATSAEMFGLDESDMRARFAPYTERFLA